jgi:Bax protein
MTRIVLCVVITVLVMPGLGFTDVLPDLPEHLENPFPDAVTHPLQGAADLQRLFSEVNYELDGAIQTKTVPGIFVTNIPEDLNALPVHQKTSTFIRLLLTSVLKVNDHTLVVRSELKHLADKHQRGIPFSERELEWLRDVAQDHYCSVFDFTEMLRRVDIMPVGLTMAQAIDESGWGTSHFAKEGNALYGQHLSQNSGGKYLATSDGSVKVAVFDNLYHSTASYLHNINTSKAYAALREKRAIMREKHGYLSGMNLAGGLERYSARGKHYVNTLLWLIKHYQLDALGETNLEFTDSPLLVVFP